MASTAKRPRRSDDYESAYYDNVPGTSMTRTSAASNGAPYLAPYPRSHSAAAANGTLAGTTSPLLTSHLSVAQVAATAARTSASAHQQHLSSGAEDNEDMAPPKSTSTTATRAARGRGRGRPRGRGRGRGIGTSRSTEPAHLYDDDDDDDGDDDGEEDDDSRSNLLTFQCRSCFRLVGDSLSFVATDPELGYVILSSVTEVVAQSSTYETSTEPGKDIGSTFARLRCAGCNACIGRNYRTTPRDLDQLRDCFSLQVDAIFTYQLGSNHSKQLEADQARHRSRGGKSQLLTADKQLEIKMERTRALTIELSDRLIKAEQDIRRYSAMVQQLMHKPAPLESQPVPTVQADNLQHELAPVPTEQQQTATAAQHPETTSTSPPPPPSPLPTTTTMTEQAAQIETATPPLKQESQTSPSSSSRKPPSQSKYNTRRSTETSNLVVPLDSSNGNQLD